MKYFKYYINKYGSPDQINKIYLIKHVEEKDERMLLGKIFLFKRKKN